MSAIGCCLARNTSEKIFGFRLLPKTGHGGHSHRARDSSVRRRENTHPRCSLSRAQTPTSVAVPRRKIGCDRGAPPSIAATRTLLDDVSRVLDSRWTTPRPSSTCHAAPNETPMSRPARPKTARPLAGCGFVSFQRAKRSERVKQLESSRTGQPPLLGGLVGASGFEPPTPRPPV